MTEYDKNSFLHHFQGSDTDDKYDAEETKDEVLPLYEIHTERQLNKVSL